MDKKKIKITIIFLLFFVIIRIMSQFMDKSTVKWPDEGQEQRFTGILESFDITTPRDGLQDKIVVSGRTVVIRTGGKGVKLMEGDSVWGISEIGYDNIPQFANVDVYAYCLTPDHCTLEGSNDYYVKILDK